MPRQPKITTSNEAALPSYMLNVKRLFDATVERRESIDVTAAVLAEQRGALDSRIFNADPTNESELGLLSVPAQRCAVLERQAVLFAEDLAALETKLTNALQQAKHQLIVAAGKHDDFLHAREIEEKLNNMREGDSRESIRERAQKWPRQSSDVVRTFSFEASSAVVIVRFAERIFADIPAADPEV